MNRRITAAALAVTVAATVLATGAAQAQAAEPDEYTYPSDQLPAGCKAGLNYDSGSRPGWFGWASCTRPLPHGMPLYYVTVGCPTWWVPDDTGLDQRPSDYSISVASCSNGEKPDRLRLKTVRR